MNTIIFDINENTKLLKKSALDVRKGKVAVFATDTVYGIGTGAFNKKSVLKIYKLKKRSPDKPLALLLYSLTQVKKLVVWNKNAEKLAKKFLPGALTLILKSRVSLRGKHLSPLCKRGVRGIGGLFPPFCKGGIREDFAIRIPNHKGLLKWLKTAGVAIAATSANLSGRPAITKQNEVIKQFDGKVDYILTDGDLKGSESAVVDLTGIKPVVLRKGKICKKEILKSISGEP